MLRAVFKKQKKSLKAAMRLTGSRLRWLMKPAPVNQIQDLVSSLRPRAPHKGLVRIGPNHDGGYLVPDDFDGIVACISPGVSREVGFDFEIAERGLDVFMLDASVTAPPVAHPRFHFTPKFLGNFESDRFTRLETLCSDLKHLHGDLMLQMDIEGAEWDVLQDTSSATLQRFRIIVLELHDLHEIFGQLGFRKIEPLLRKLLQTHSVVHLHPNNMMPLVAKQGVSIPPLLEVTLLRNDRLFNDKQSVKLPNALDFDCKANRPTVTMPENWWR